VTVPPQPQTIEKCTKDNELLQRSEKLLVQGDYSGALATNQELLSATDDALPKDEALYNIGVIYAHNKNPDKNYKKAIRAFKKLINKYPASPLIEQTKVWVETLQKIENLESANESLELKIENLESANESLELNNECLEEIIENLKKVDTDIEQKIKE
jgi:outer membrane protein assembly factor BamD (BamD/ComL family)